MELIVREKRIIENTTLICQGLQGMILVGCYIEFVNKMLYSHLGHLWVQVVFYIKTSLLEILHLVLVIVDYHLHCLFLSVHMAGGNIFKKL
jgi:hypothetical protein